MRLTEISQSAAGGMTAEHYSTTLALGDWDGDSKLDIVVGNRFQPFAHVLSQHEPASDPIGDDGVA